MKSLVIALACLAIGCAGEPTQTPSPDAIATAEPEPEPAPEPPLDPAEQHAAQAQALVETLEALAVIHDRDGADCPTLARAIAAFHGARRCGARTPRSHRRRSGPRHTDARGDGVGDERVDAMPKRPGLRGDPSHAVPRLD